MVAGRELDALVAEHVMGWKLDNGLLAPEEFHQHVRQEKLAAKGYYHAEANIPAYSSDIAAAWTIVDKHSSTFGTMLLQIGNGDAVCSFSRGGVDTPAVIGDTAPHAICLAALKSVGFETTSR